MKISELNTKSFLGGEGAAANSYVLINYEDNSTSEPVTYKASLQELGKAIANDLKLPSVTVSEGAITNFKVKGVSNGAYTETTVDAPSGGGGADIMESVVLPPLTGADESIYGNILIADSQNTFYKYNGSDTTRVPVMIDPAQFIEIEDTYSDEPLTSYILFTNSTGEKIYFVDDSGIQQLVNLGGHREPMVVYDSSSGLGYYDPDSSEINPLNVVTFAVDDNDSSKINLYTATGSIIAQIDAYSYY